MDALTHVFLPLTVVYVLRSDLFERRHYFALAAFGLFPDLDKFLGMPGLLHSLVTLVPICLILLGAEYAYRRSFTASGLATFFIASHLVLDFLDGSGVYLLRPFVETGIALAYPGGIVFGEGLLGVTIRGLPITVVTTYTRPGFARDPGVHADAYGFIDGFGVASMLTFFTIYLGREYWGGSGPESGS